MPFDMILARVRTLMAFVLRHSILIDLRPETEEIQPMIKCYYEGVDHLHGALKAFLAAKEYWQEIS